MRHGLDRRQQLGPRDRDRSGELVVAGRPRVRDRVLVRLRSRSLDRALAEGADPEETVALALRSRLLTTLTRRRVIADSLRTMLADGLAGPAPPRRWRAAPPARMLASASDELSELADLLARPGPVGTRGVAQAWLLVTDGSGPLYTASGADSLRASVASAVADLRLAER